MMNAECGMRNGKRGGMGANTSFKLASRPPQRRMHRAFTLIELILVLLIIAISLAMVAPSFRGWSQGTKLKNTAEQMIAAAGFARSQAIATANVYRLEVDASSGIYRVSHQEDGRTASTAGEFGSDTLIPAGFRLDLKTGGLTGSTIEFYPNGRTTISTIRVTAANGDWIDVGVEAAAEKFHLLGQK